MNLNLAGKTVVVTGGGSNIGRGIVLAFAGEGSNVAIADIDEPQGQKTAAAARSLGCKAIAVKTDVTSVDSIENMVKNVIAEFSKIEVLVNNAGWVIDRMFMEKPRAEWEKEVNINFWGAINCTRAVLPHMIEKGYGKIINISSDAGRMGEYREVVYSGCKGGIIAMSKALARELGRNGININVICPALTVPAGRENFGEESMWAQGLLDVFNAEALKKAAAAYPLRRLGTVEDVANAAVFLASDAAGYITGQTLSVDGGYTMF